MNVNAKGGELRTEILDAEGKVIAPFTTETSIPLQIDGTRNEETMTTNLNVALTGLSDREARDGF